MNDREREKEADVAHKNHAERIASMKAGLARDAPDDQQGGDQLAAGAGLGAKAVRAPRRSLAPIYSAAAALARLPVLRD